MGIDLRGVSLRPHWDKLLFLVGALYLLGVSFWLYDQRQRPHSSPPPQATVEDAKFIAYLQQSLRLLQNTPPRPATTAPSPPNLPAVPLPPSMATSALPPLPPVTASQPAPPPLPSYYPPFPPTSPAQVTVPPAIAPAKSNPTNAIPPMVKAKQPHSLVGVLESGDRSSALFSWDGLTQRIQVGEAIGGSGWTLMGVSNQKAILSRQGKTRYLEVGQSF